MARPMRIVSSVPEAPTSVPPMIRAVFSSTKPVEAAARPVNAFNSEITTGMSAPPMGRTSRTPKRRAPITSTIAQTPASVAPARTPTPTSARNRTPFTTCWPAKTIGRPGSSSCSLPNAIRLPEKLIDPIRAEKSKAPMCSGSTCPGSGASRWNSAAAIRAAAPPPTPLKSATICGIAVIFTRRAEATPITLPTAIPAAINQ